MVVCDKCRVPDKTTSPVVFALGRGQGAEPLATGQADLCNQCGHAVANAMCEAFNNLMGVKGLSKTNG
jgi:hypothetical protein